MSIATLKKKTQSNNYRNHSGIGGFSLNSSRRVESHSGETSIQTMMKGTGYKSSGMRGPSTIVKSQYVNYDIPDVPRPTNKNNKALLSYKLKWLNGGYPKNVVKSTERIDYETYMAKLHLFTQRTYTIPRSGCLEKTAIAKDTTVQPYEIYQKTKLLERNCLPLQKKDLHYPPALQCNSSNSKCVNNLTYEEFLNTVSCA